MSARSRVVAYPHKLATVAAVLAVALTSMVAAADSARAATATESTAALTTYHLLNSERAANHLPALGWSAALVSSARRHNLTMAQANVLSHQLPGEAVFRTRISQAGVAWHSAAENIGWTTNRSSAGSMAMQTAMYNEKAPNNGHRLNILSTSVHYVGIDTYIDAKTGKLWLTEDFADVAGAPVVSAAHAPIGNLESATALAGHKVRLSGWAVDPDSKALPIFIGVYYDGHFAGYFRFPTARPDVAKAKGAGPDQGYAFTLTLPAGRHTVTTYCLNVGAGSGQTKLASKLVTT
ncbi:MAG: CAP domain-containing protein [Jatrophihabitans sp.]